MKKVQLMNTYISNLAILNIKMHNLHWNITGIQFMPIHKFTEELYDDFFIKYDVVAEQLKMLGDSPLATTKDYLENATVTEVPAKDFNTNEVLKILVADLNLMKDLATEIRNIADQEDDFTTVMIFEDHVAGYSKNLWFINSMLK